MTRRITMTQMTSGRIGDSHTYLYSVVVESGGNVLYAEWCTGIDDVSYTLRQFAYALDFSEAY